MYVRTAADLEPEVRLLKVNADQEPQIAADLGVSGISALCLIQGGRVLSSGAMDARRVVAWVPAHLGKAAGA
jgi:thioredoxin 2